MNDHLPELPASLYATSGNILNMNSIPMNREELRAWGQQCYEAGVASKMEIINAAHDCLRGVLKLPESAPRRFDYYAREIEAQSAKGGEHGTP